MHTPIDKTEETHLSTELFDALAFANQKLEELVLIHSALTQGTESISNELETYRNVHHTIRSSVHVTEKMSKRRTALKEEDFSRPLPFEKRYELQQAPWSYRYYQQRLLVASRKQLKFVKREKNGVTVLFQMNNMNNLLKRDRKMDSLPRRNWA